jgi:hypothetical protein
MSKRKSSISSVISSAKKLTSKFWDKYDYDDYSAKSDYWLRGSLFDKKKSFFEDDKDGNGDKYDYFALSQYQRAITNFVHIMTGRPEIKVSYENNGESFTDGKTVTLSASIKEKDFDSNVGLALHEASHIVYSDFSLLKETIDSVTYRPDESVRNKLIDKKGNCIFTELEEAYDYGIKLSSLIKPVINIVEDLYIDAMTYASAPGYRGYYKALYHKFFGDEQIVLGFHSRNYSKPTQTNYLFHLCNIRNPQRNLKALPDLDIIWSKLDLINIRRLSTAQSRVNLAWEITSLIVENIKNYKDEHPQDAGDEQHQDTEYNDYEPLSDKALDKIEKMFTKQLDLICGDVKKSKLSKSAIDNVTALSSVDMRSEFTGKEFNYKGVKTLVIRNLTETFLKSEIASSFGIRNYNPWYGLNETTMERYINLGKILAKKLQIRNEERTLVSSRLKSGSIDKRLLHEIGADKYEVFKKININQHKPSYIHISIDASGSMSGIQFNEAIKFATMFATASKFIRNIHVVVSVRTTTSTSTKTLKEIPFIMYVFDSKVNGLNHVRKLFPRLSCPGTTPEGLTFEAIMKEVKKDSANTDAFFINICDGEPCFSDRTYTINYGGTEAKQHSKKQIDRMMSFGINALNYFIGSNNGFREFQKTYPANSFHLESADEIQNIVKVMNSNLLRSANY